MTVPYTVLDRPARKISLEGDQFLTAELYDGYFSLSWSCDMSLLEVLDRLAQVVPREAMAPAQVVAAEGTTEYSTVMEAIEKIDRPDRVVSLRADYVGFSFVWQAPTLRRAGRDPLKVNHGEAGLIADVFDSAFCLAVMQLTSSEAVVRSAPALSHAVAYLGEHVKPGKLPDAE